MKKISAKAVKERQKILNERKYEFKKLLNFFFFQKIKKNKNLRGKKIPPPQK